jgi:uncharacterized protein (TIGR02145 family)
MIKNLAPMILAVFLFGCQGKEIELPGDISGHVKDVVTEESVKDAEVQLFHTNDLLGTDTTGMDGTFLFTNLKSENYSIEVIKDNYDTHTENITVFPARTSELEIIISGVPDPEFSEPWLNFGMESTQLSFSISNAGGGILSYEISPTQDWISVSPESGELTLEPDIIEVTIQKEGEALQDRSHQAWIAIHSDILGEIQVDRLEVYVNYVIDQDSILYRTTRIGNQIWMAENLNTGIRVEAPGDIPTTDNGIIEKLCYDNDPLNCDVFGGLYMWNEMMDYAQPDTGGIRITQGICPDGWHVPTHQEWVILGDYLGEDVAGGMLKDTSLLWGYQNTGATNETGFSALPAGVYLSHIGEEEFRNIGRSAYFWTTYYNDLIWNVYQLWYYEARLIMNPFSYGVSYPNAKSVRCVKDP